MAGEGTVFLPLTPDQKLVLMARAEMGYLGYYNKYKQSPFERSTWAATA